MPGVTPEFLSLPLATLADAALARARELGAEYAALRVVSTRHQLLALRDLDLETSVTSDDVGLSVRVIHDGAWGFAAGLALTPEQARTLAERAVAVARVAPTPLPPNASRSPRSRRTPDRQWSSPYEVDPFSVSDADKVATLVDLSERLKAGDGVGFTHAQVQAVRENVYYADSAGTTTTQTRVRVEPELTATTVDRADGGVRVDADARAGRLPPDGSTSGRSAPGSSARSPRSPSCWRPRSRPRRCAPATTTSSSTAATSSSPSTSRSGTPPSSTACSATKRHMPERRSRPTTSSARSATALRS